MRQFAAACVALSTFIIVFVLCIQLFRVESQRPSGEREGKLSGAREALDFWTRARAYPNNDIPPDKYYKAFAYSKMRMKKLPHEFQSATGWESIGPNNLSGRCLSVAVNPFNGNTIYVGSASGGLWRSYTAGLGADWQRIETGYPVLGVASVAISPVDSNVIYIGTGEVYRYQGAYGGLIVRTTRGSYGVGILKTTDGGTTWTKTLDWSSNQQTGVQAVKINPLNPNTVWAATTEGFVRTTDAGAHWDIPIPLLQGIDMLMNPSDTNRFMISYGNFGNNPGVSVTTDNGGSWTQCALPPFSGKTTLGMFQSNPNIVWASVADSTTYVGTLWKSTDFGFNWTLMQSYAPPPPPPPGGNPMLGVQGWYSHYVAVHPTDQNQIVHAAVDAQKSTDGGTTFFGVGGLYSDNHGYAIDPNNPNILYSANDDGIYRSTNFGSSFNWIGYGLVTGQLYNGFSCSSSDPHLAIGQSQDHIPGYIYTGNPNWGRSAADEAGWTATNPQDDHFMYAVTRFGESIRRSTNRGASFGPGLSFLGDAAWSSPIIVSPSDPDVLYFGKFSVYKSTDAGASWFTTSTAVINDGNTSLSIAMSFTNRDTVYIGKGPFASRTHFYRTTNGGTTWTDITGPTPDRYPLDIAVDPNNSRIVYACFGGYGTGHIFKSTDAGISWADVSSVLPDCPVTAAVVDPLNSNYVYIGTDIGAYVSTNAGTSWNSFSEGFTDAVLISDLVISPSNRKLRAVTHGNGVFERDLPSTLPFVQLTTPNGGEHWDATSTHTISWSEGLAGTLLLEYSTNNGASWDTIATGVNSMIGSYSWTIPFPTSNHARVRISSETQPGLSDESDNTFYITFNGAIVITENGWKMISLPVNAPSPTRTNLFPYSLTPAYEYTGSYVAKETLAVGVGYWMNFGENHIIPILGDSVMNDSIPVVEGWNMIGSITSPIAVSAIASDPPGLVTSNFFTFINGYVVKDSILPGVGYWVKVSQNGKLILSAASAGSAANAIRIVPTSELPPPAPNDATIRRLISDIPDEFSLGQNYPNPFNPSTNFELRISKLEFVTLKVFDVLGREVATLINERRAPGIYNASWNAANMPSGIYLYKLKTESFTQTRKMILAR
ncbi:MAG: T9SS type A sorting domain-containing protein [Ignavibacteriae bacterium]|nr:T9SS type A sorting domain-containing protein [Ignavibacteriota bacterium]